MLKTLFRNVIKIDRVFISCMFLMLTIKFLLQRYQLFTLHNFSDVPFLLLGVFGAASINLFVFFLAAIFTNEKSKVWWKQKTSYNGGRERMLKIWSKSLIASFVIFLVGTLGAVLFFGSIYTLILLFISILYYNLRLMIKNA